MIAGIVLAAGASRRLGRPKQLLPLDGQPLLAWVLAAMRAAFPDQCILVLGHEADAIRAAIDLSGVEVVLNEQYAEGLSSSLRAGLRAARAEITAAVLATGDQPLVTTAMLGSLPAIAGSTGQPIVATDYGDHLGVPLLLARAMWPLADTISGDQGARALLRARPELVASVPADDASLALDIDTEADYERLRALVERGAQRPRVFRVWCTKRLRRIR